MIVSILTFLLVLSVLVLIHELGHFLTARILGVKVEEFGFGLPPKLWGKKIGETTYSLNALPFGGFVRLYGEDSREKIEKKDIGRAFFSKSKLARSVIIVAGVISNFILAVLAFSIVYSNTGIPRETNNVRVIEVVSGSPAQVANFIPGDVIRSVDGVKVESTKTFIDYVSSTHKRVNVEVERDGEIKKLSVMPRENPPEGQGAIGVVVSSVEIFFPPWWQRPLLGVQRGFDEAYYWGKTILVGLGSMVAGAFRGQAPKDIAGPVGIFAATSEVSKMGIIAVVNFIGILSVNLGIVNILPFPALDGGRLAFIGIEGLFGKRVLPKAESIIHSVGMAILLALILAITANDIRRLIEAGSLSKFLEGFAR